MTPIEIEQLIDRNKKLEAAIVAINSKCKEANPHNGVASVMECVRLSDVFSDVEQIIETL